MYVCTMKDEKRVLKGYKIKDSIYKKAMKRARKSKIPLASMVEAIVIAYAEGGVPQKPIVVEFTNITPTT